MQMGIDNHLCIKRKYYGWTRFNNYINCRIYNYEEGNTVNRDNFKRCLMGLVSIIFPPLMNKKTKYAEGKFTSFVLGTYNLMCIYG